MRPCLPAGTSKRNEKSRIVPGLTAVSLDTARQSELSDRTTFRFSALGTRATVTVAATTIQVAPSGRDANASPATPERSRRRRDT